MSCAHAARAVVERDRRVRPARSPSLPNAWLARKGSAGPCRRARVTIAFPGREHRRQPADTGRDRGRQSLRSRRGHGPAPGDDARARAAYRKRFELPRQGIAGTRALTGVARGRSSARSSSPTSACRRGDRGAGRRALRGGHRLHQGRRDLRRSRPRAAGAARAGGDGAWCARTRTAPASTVMVAFNITDEIDAMLPPCRPGRARGRHLRDGEPELVRLLRDRGAAAAHRLALHGHRNGFGAFSRHPAARHLLPGLSDAVAACRAWTTCTCTACAASSRRADEEVIASAHATA